MRSLVLMTASAIRSIGLASGTPLKSVGVEQMGRRSKELPGTGADRRGGPATRQREVVYLHRAEEGVAGDERSCPTSPEPAAVLKAGTAMIACRRRSAPP